MHDGDELRVDRLIAVPAGHAGPRSTHFEGTSDEENPQTHPIMRSLQTLSLPRRAAASFNKSLQATRDGALSSAFAVHVIGPAWLSSHR